MVYRERLSEIPEINFREEMPRAKHNYYNFVITIEKSEFGFSRDKLYEKLKRYNIFTRKYFYPFYSQFFSSSSKNFPVAKKITKEVLRLPLYGDLKVEDIHQICDILYSLHKFKLRPHTTHHDKAELVQAV